MSFFYLVTQIDKIRILTSQMVVTGYVISMPRYSFRFGPVEIRQRIAPYNVQLGRVLLVGGLGLQQRAAFQRVDTSLSLPNGE